MAREREVIDAPYQIICEGADECEFLVRLVRDRSLGNIQVGCGRGKDGRCLGKSGFKDRIIAIKDNATVPIRGYLIIADSDDNPADRFKNACTQLHGHGFPVPSSPNTVAEKDNLKTAVWMVPSPSEEGGLETILLACCDAVTSFSTCIDEFCKCVATPRRKLDSDKLRLRALIAATCPKDPGTSLSYWVCQDTRPFNMDHPALDGISRFIEEFAT
jgi:hypothetical protein